MRRDWNVTTLDELVNAGVVTLGRGNVISKRDMEADPGPYPVYSSAQNNDGRIGTYNKYMFDEELITWSVDGGGYVFYRPHHRFSVTNIGGYLRIMDSTKFLYPFLAAALQQQHGQHVFDWQNKAHPSVIRKLYNSIPLVPIEEQRRIMDLVSSVDAYIDALQQQVESARVARSAVLHNLLTAGGEDWTETTIGEMAQWQGGITPSMANDGYWKDGMIPWISSGDVLQLNTRGAQKHVTDAALEETSVKLLPVNTVLVVVRSGILVHTLPVAILETPSTINQDIKAGVPHSAVLGQFLFWVLRSNSQTILETCRKTGTTVQSISTEAFLKFPVLLPPLVEQKRIVEIVSSMDEAIQSTEKAVLDAKVLRTALLSDLLSGNHEIPASYDSLLGAA